MELAMAISPGEESAVDDFAVHLFRALGYTGRAVARTTRTRKDLPFLVCGEERHAKADVCIMDGLEILLLVQEDKRHLDSSDPEPQLIANAIAAFYNNNITRVQALGLPTLQDKVIPRTKKTPAQNKRPKQATVTFSNPFTNPPELEAIMRSSREQPNWKAAEMEGESWEGTAEENVEKYQRIMNPPPVDWPKVIGDLTGTGGD